MAATGVLSLPAWAVPAAAAPSDSVVAEALKVRTTLAQLIRGEQRGAATGVDDGYPGGVWVTSGDTFSCSAGMLKTYCWGAGDAGQLGAGTTTDAVDPVEVEGFDYQDGDLVGAMSAGRAHTCALAWFDESDSGGELSCWGDNAEGQVGDGTTTQRSEPVEVEQNVRQVATGADHTCAILDDGDVACWGRNDQGQLGAGAAGPSVLEPQPVPGLSDVVDLAAGGDSTCAIDEDGGAWCWGADTDGQLGDGSGAGAGSAVPVEVVMADVDGDFGQIEVGDRHACAVTEDGVAWCWGDDTDGQLGDGAAAADPSQPVEVTTDDQLFSISAGADSTCAVALSGTTLCWGANAEGQLGTGDRTDVDAPAEVDLSDIPRSPFLGPGSGQATAASGFLVEVTVGETHACGLDVQGNTYCWGDNSRGQIGDGTTDDALTPVATSLLPGPATDVEVTPGDGRLVVSWSPPTDLGSSDLLGMFTVASAEDGFGVGFCRGVSDRCVVDDLVNGTEYEVVVVTQTDGGLALSEAVPGMPVALASPAPGGGGGQLPITGAAVSLIIAVGGALVAGGMLCLRLVRRRWR
jgi:alpha-tubulin suppressor-like RCC1 family protein